jgi:hypothetical protein
VAVNPIIVDLGKAKNKELEQLRTGAGRLQTEVMQALEHVTSELADDLKAGKRIVPVVVTYRKKRPKGDLGWLLGR